jgi:hypothetical protein
MAACAAFFKESRMKFANATKLDRKSGVAQWRDLQFLFSTLRWCDVARVDHRNASVVHVTYMRKFSAIREWRFARSN